jgi:hypothetical protein
VSFLIKLFSIKGNLVFMKNLYRKVAVASVCTALGFAMGASEEVKAATITVPPTIQFGVKTRYDRLNFVTTELSSQYDEVSSGPGSYTKRLAEFNISSFFLAPNTIIKSAIFQDKLSQAPGNPPGSPITLSILGYVGNGTAEVSDAGKGVFLNSVNISSLSAGDTLNFDVTAFVNQQVSNGNPFAGFAMNISFVGGARLGGTDALGRSSLVIETVDTAEPVPEPTTIFGSAIGLCLGGWLKRKKSSQQQHKTTSPG